MLAGPRVPVALLNSWRRLWILQDIKTVGVPACMEWQLGGGDRSASRV